MIRREERVACMAGGCPGSVDPDVPFCRAHFAALPKTIRHDLLFAPGPLVRRIAIFVAAQLLNGINPATESRP